jgi:hypothetical protein
MQIVYTANAQLYFILMLLLLSVCSHAQKKVNDNYPKTKFKAEVVNNAAIIRSKKLMDQQLERFHKPRYAYLFGTKRKRFLSRRSRF